MKQEEIEARYSQKNVHSQFNEEISNELDGYLTNWYLGTVIRIKEFLDTKPHLLDTLRIRELKSYFKESPDRFEEILIHLMTAVLRKGDDQTLQTCLGYLKNFMPHEDETNKIESALDLITLGTLNRKNDIYSIAVINDSPYVVLSFKSLVLNKHQKVFKYISNVMFNPPLVEKPLKVYNNVNCGYHTIKQSLLLGDFSYHTNNLDYESINILNSVEWVLDPKMLKHKELPPKKFKTSEQFANFRKFAKESKNIYDLLKDRIFHFGHGYDSRGRIYCHGYHVNLQGSEYKKAILNFSKYEKIT